MHLIVGWGEVERIEKGNQAKVNLGKAALQPL